MQMLVMRMHPLRLYHAACPKALRPNLLIVLADDVGIADLPAYSQSAPVPLPALDSLAANGVLFANAHAHALCAPSRFALLSGNLPLRANGGSVDWNLGHGSFAAGQRSLAEALRATFGERE